MIDALIRFDHRLFFLINGSGREWLDPVFWDLSVMGSWTIALVAIALLADKGKRVLFRHLLILLASMAIAAPLNTVIKESVGRYRPMRKFEPEIKAEIVKVRVVGEVVKRKSFPSGHSMLAFFLMTYVGFYRKGARIWILLLAFLIAYSRVYVGAHFPFDCVAGSLLGALGGWLAWLAYKRFNKPKAQTA